MRDGGLYIKRHKGASSRKHWVRGLTSPLTRLTKIRYKCQVSGVPCSSCRTKAACTFCRLRSLYISTLLYTLQLTSKITLPSCALTSSLSTSCVSSTSPHCSV